MGATSRSASLKDIATSPVIEDDGSLPWVQKEEKLTLCESQHFAAQLVQIFWRLLLARPQNVALAPVGLPGLTCVEATVQVYFTISVGWFNAFIIYIALIFTNAPIFFQCLDFFSMFSYL